MKFKTNISALLLALLVFISTNGVALSHNICNTAGTHSLSFFFYKSYSGAENKESSCCGMKNLKSSKPCCEHKQIFQKLKFDGFTAKEFEVKSYKIVSSLFIFNGFTSSILYASAKNHSGIPPPDILQIKDLLRPTLAGLQTYRC